MSHHPHSLKVSSKMDAPGLWNHHKHNWSATRRRAHSIHTPTMKPPLLNLAKKVSPQNQSRTTPLHISPPSPHYSLRFGPQSPTILQWECRSVHYKPPLYYTPTKKPPFPDLARPTNTQNHSRTSPLLVSPPSPHYSLRFGPHPTTILQLECRSVHYKAPLYH